MLIWGLVSLSGPKTHAAVVFDQLGQTYTQDFQDYDGSGMQPGGGSGTLDSTIWEVGFFGDGTAIQSGAGAVHGVGLFGRGLSPGGATEEGLYAFATGNGNIALGLQHNTAGLSGSFPAILLTNNTGGQVDVIDVRYDMYVFNDTPTEYYADLEFTQGNLYTDPVFFETPAAADATPGWTRTVIEHQLFLPTTSTNAFPDQLTPLANGESIEVGWSIGNLGGVGLSDGIAIDNLSISMGTTAIPEPTFALALSAALALVVCRRPTRRKADFGSAR